jgi:acetyl esterase/lipase
MTGHRFAERLDPEVAAVLDGLPRYDLDDIVEARRRRKELAEATRALAAPNPDVVVDEVTLPGRAPGGVVARVSRPRVPRAGAGRLLWVHGGGHVLGEAAQDDWLMADVVADTGCTAVAVEWRRAPEDPYPAALDDCYDALRWLASPEHGAGPLVVGGASSGGGLAAGVVLQARDLGEVRIDAQLLIYPMLDDRESASMRAVTDPRVWHRGVNAQAWAAYLRAVAGGPGSADVPAYAAPARAADLSGLPFTWLATAELDGFVDENVEYAARLLRSGVSTELHVFPGGVHGFDLFAPDAAITRRFVAERRAALVRLLRSAAASG